MHEKNEIREVEEGGGKMISTTGNKTVVAEKVNSLIHDNLTDMWLLLSGEQLEARSIAYSTRTGHPLAMNFGGQVHILEGRLEALEKLRVLGIEMQ